jgi:hypothetical protein
VWSEIKLLFREKTSSPCVSHEMEEIGEYTSEDERGAMLHETTPSDFGRLVPYDSESDMTFEVEDTAAGIEEDRLAAAVQLGRSASMADPEDSDLDVKEDDTQHDSNEILKTLELSGFYNVSTVWGKVKSSFWLLAAESRAEAFEKAEQKLHQNPTWQSADAILREGHNGQVWICRVGDTLLRGKSKIPFLVLQLRHQKSGTRTRPRALIANLEQVRNRTPTENVEVELVYLETEPSLGESVEEVFATQSAREYLEDVVAAFERSQQEGPRTVSETPNPRKREPQPKSAQKKTVAKKSAARGGGTRRSGLRRAARAATKRMASNSFNYEDSDSEESVEEDDQQEDAPPSRRGPQQRTRTPNPRRGRGTAKRVAPRTAKPDSPSGDSVEDAMDIDSGPGSYPPTRTVATRPLSASVPPNYSTYQLPSVPFAPNAIPANGAAQAARIESTMMQQQQQMMMFENNMRRLESMRNSWLSQANPQRQQIFHTPVLTNHKTETINLCEIAYANRAT